MGRAVSQSQTAPDEEEAQSFSSSTGQRVLSPQQPRTLSAAPARGVALRIACHRLTTRVEIFDRLVVGGSRPSQARTSVRSSVWHRRPLK